MKERVKVYYKSKASEEVKIVHACEDSKKDSEIIFKLHGYFYSYFRSSSNFYVNDKRLLEGGKNWMGECSMFDYMFLPYGYSSWKDFVEEDDDIEYIQCKPEGMTEEDLTSKIPCTPTISDWATECLVNWGNNEGSRRQDLLDVLMEGAKAMEEFEKKNDPTHPNHYAQGGISVWDVIRAYTNGLNGVDAFNAGNAIKYILRWHHKNGVEDLEKAKVYIDELIKSQKEKEK